MIFGGVCDRNNLTIILQDSDFERVDYVNRLSNMGILYISFKDKNMTSPMEEFGLNFEQTKILYSFQYFLVQQDIDRETEFVKKQLKLRYLNKWSKSVENFLGTLASNDLQKNNSFLYTDYSLFEEAFKIMKWSLDKRRPLYTIVLELSLFNLYAPFGTEEDEQFKKLKLSETFRPIIIETLVFFANELGVEKEHVTRFKSNYQKWNNEITGSNPLNFLLGGLIAGVAVAAVAAAIAIPILVPLLAPILAPGLSGAAAISAVLAALGGGAIAAGGFGMAGGMAVIVGGGAILGTGAGTGISSLFAQSPNLAVREAAKFLVTFNDIILVQEDVIKQEIALNARNIIKGQRNAINEPEEQILEMQMATNNNQEQISNLQKVVKYLRKALEISQSLLKSFLCKNGLQ
ncbi:hypothetical protein ANSO36C_40850 [Nostoc cf. commune SO-36]|uniref:Transmembrane protein n=1 Tax=Nostoc cf. commune SO-36 TaxID=449208 RepID=A0ABN6Q4V9_NOSCO|nr:hypothetical protein [Nostoc commune]BDI18283.1 hypothetical protein ANSO36C_40850 [Nostoc cf. commune SO-36]